MKKRGNISIKLTNILKQTKECCETKKCPKDVKRCKPRKGERRKKRRKKDVGIFGGMPDIRPTSRAIAMPQSIMNNISPVPNIPLPIQLPAYSQFRRPPTMYQRNNRPYQTQQAGTITPGVTQDRVKRGRSGTADQPFNASQPPPNILDYEAILMRNAEEDRRVASQRRIEMRDRFQSTLQDIGAGTPRDVDIEEEEEEELEQQIEGTKQLIEDSDLAMNQGQTGFTADRIADLEPTGQVSDQPVRTIRRGRPTIAEAEIIRRRTQNLRDQGLTQINRTPMQILAMSDEQFDFSDDEIAGAGGGTPR